MARCVFPPLQRVSDTWSTMYLPRVSSCRRAAFREKMACTHGRLIQSKTHRKLSRSALNLDVSTPAFVRIRWVSPSAPSSRSDLASNSLSTIWMKTKHEQGIEIDHRQERALMQGSNDAAPFKAPAVSIKRSLCGSREAEGQSLIVCRYSIVTCLLSSWPSTYFCPHV